MITLVNTFAVHGSTDAFEEAFRAVSDFMRRQPGFRHHRLLRTQEDSRCYINIAEWEDEESLRAALARPGFRRRADRLGRLATPRPRVGRTVLDAGPEAVRRG